MNQKSTKVKLIQFLGLQNFLVKKFLFKPPQPNYQFVWNGSRLEFYLMQDKTPIKIENYLLNVDLRIITDQKNTFVPVILLTQKRLQLQSSGESYSLSSSQIRKDMAQQKLLVIYSHGNGSDLSDSYFFAEKVALYFGIDILSYDYSGYGLGKGHLEISEQQMYYDLQSVVSYAVFQLDYKLEQIILLGFSLGCGPTVELAMRYQSVAGIILLAPFASVSLLIDDASEYSDESDLFRNIVKVDKLKCSIMIVHGENDKLVEIRHSSLLEKKILKEANCNDFKFIHVESVGHNNILSSIFQEQVRKEILDFLFVTMEALEISNVLHPNQHELNERQLGLLRLFNQEVQIQQQQSLPFQGQTKQKCTPTKNMKTIIEQNES